MINTEEIKINICKKKIPNHLINEKSPYLMQHAYNPVDWYPWGEEAFARAEKENKPVLLSIGYSTCHWCHVMEKESFTDPAIAGIMNENFICIKVDREEKPHLDDKILTSWNGLMISALCKAYRVLGDGKYLEAAKNATEFILSDLYDEKTGRLFRRWRAGEKNIFGMGSDFIGR